MLAELDALNASNQCSTVETGVEEVTNLLQIAHRIRAVRRAFRHRKASLKGLAYKLFVGQTVCAFSLKKSYMAG